MSADLFPMQTDDQVDDSIIDAEFEFTDEPVNEFAPVSQATPSGPAPDFVRQLREETLGCKITIHRFGTSRQLPTEQVRQAAETFHASAGMMSASKKLLDRRDPRVKRVAAVLSQASQFWYASTIDFPVNGIRLINKKRIGTFNSRIQEMQETLAEACADLQAAWDEIKANARNTLGDLYNELDYPPNIASMFSIEVDYPSVEPPNHLKELNPELYEAQQQKIAARFQEALAEAEEALTTSLADMVNHLVEKLSPEDDGKKKVLYESSVGNLMAFFDDFESVNIRSNEQLNHVVAQAKSILSGVDVKEIRKDGSLRQKLLDTLAPVKESLDGMVATKPSRAISFDLN